LTLDDVTNGAVAAIATYPKIGAFLDERRIRESTEANWPDAPAPLVFWLWMSQSELLGRIPTAALLAGLEGLLTALEVGTWVTGDWRGRVKKLVPPRDKSDFDHYSNFRSALFELNLSVRLVCSSTVTIQPDGPTRGCDLLIADANGPVAEVEAYAPQRGVRETYNQELVTNWSMLVGGDPLDLLPPETDEAVRCPSTPLLWLMPSMISLRSATSQVSDSSWRRLSILPCSQFGHSVSQPTLQR